MGITGEVAARQAIDRLNAMQAEADSSRERRQSVGLGATSPDHP